MDYSKKPFSYRVSEFFIKNHRVALLSLFLITLLGVGSTLLMKTTGFPNPPINIVIVQTVYPGASAQTIAQEITQPLEGAIKDVSGVDSFSSQSFNSGSVVSINIEENADIENVRSQIDSAVKGVQLPDGVESPRIMVPDVGGPSIIFSVASTNLEDVYKTYERISGDIAELPETAKIEPINPISRVLNVTLDADKMEEYGITASQVQQQLASLSETIPVISDVTIDGKNQTIQTSISGTTIEDIRAIEFRVTEQAATASAVEPVEGALAQYSAASAPTGSTAQAEPVTHTYILDDIADVDIGYRFKDDTTPLIGIRSNNEPIVVPAVTVQVYATSGTALAQYTEDVHSIFASIEDEDENKKENTKGNFIQHGEENTASADQLLIVEHFASQNENQRQVNEVVSGLVGGPLHINNALKNIGWVLGGMQLVFLVMLAFVSWRSAVVAALAIPLSLLFANIYLYFTGNDLNTLVLFSLVLVIGLVVDPALVILESIQRKIDAGLKGKEAALAAIADVGGGLFLATITNIIVFAPFAMISGILGEIFKYIPLTIIPAVIGSYVVPLIFLAWIGGLFLRPKKNAQENEEKNLWGIARWLIRVNTTILNSSIWLRIGIIIAGFIIPVLVAGYFFASGKISVVQFSSGDDSELLSMNLQFTSSATQQQTTEEIQKTLETVVDNSAVRQVYPITADQNYYINLAPSVDRPEYKAKNVAQDVQKMIPDVEHILYDLQTQAIFAGPPTESYQVALAIHHSDPAILRNASVDMAKVLSQVCLQGKAITISEQCDGERIVTKVDDGYTGKESHIIDVTIDRNQLSEKNLVTPGNAPLTIGVNSQIKELFDYNNGESVQTVQLDGYDTDIYIKPKNEFPDTADKIKNKELRGGTTVDDIADVNNTSEAASIRRVNGQTLAVVQARLAEGFNDQATASQVSTAIVEYYQQHTDHTTELGIAEDAVEPYSEGFTASSNKSFQELFLALLMAIVLTYIVLAIFFDSFTLPLVILFAIPLTFLGVFPGLYAFAGGQFGFFEIIGMIILIGIVENVAIFLIDAARQKIKYEKWDEKRAIAYASGIRFRPVILTKFTAVASLLPLAVLSDTYRSLAVVIMCGLITSGITSLFTTPILFIFFRWLSQRFEDLQWWQKILFLLFSPIYIVILAIKNRK